MSSHEAQQRTTLRVLSRTLIVFSLFFCVLLSGYHVFCLSADGFLEYQKSGKESLHITQLDTYYENRQFAQMRAYMQDYSLDGDDYLKYQQALELFDDIQSFRSACFYLSVLTEPELEGSSSVIESILQLAYALYHYQDYSPYLLLISPNQDLLTDYRTEVTMTLQNVLHITDYEILTLRQNDALLDQTLQDLSQQLERRMIRYYA